MAKPVRVYADADLSPTGLSQRLRDAMPTMREIAADPNGTELRRAEAVRWLLEFRRRQTRRRIDREQQRIDGDQQRIDGDQQRATAAAQVHNFFASQIHRILDDADPAAAMTEFVHGRPSRGRPTTPGNRDRLIAVEVEVRRREGQTIEQAANALATARGSDLSEERVREIYYALRRVPRERRAIDAEVEMRARNWLNGEGKGQDEVEWGKLHRVVPSDPA
jgi:hypothetical protein